MIILAKEIAKFREWAVVRRSPEYRAGQFSHSSAEWECDYPDWQKIYQAVESFLDSAADRNLTIDETELLLYALARDNEDERVLDTLQKFPTLALQIGRAALTHSDADARWQSAVLLCRIGTLDAVALLRRFSADDAEYVRRRAKLALQETEPKLGKLTSNCFPSSASNLVVSDGQQSLS